MFSATGMFIIEWELPDDVRRFSISFNIRDCYEFSIWRLSMRSGNNRKDFCCYNNQKKEQSSHKLNRSLLNHVFNVPVAIRLIVITAVMSLSAGSALGQYMVQPMQLNLNPRAGNMLRTALQIHSFDPNQVLSMSLKVVELGQEEDSGWLIFNPDPNDEHDYVKDFDVSKLSSCSDWISLSRTNVEVNPLGQEPVEITVRVPRGVGGFYCAGILASLTVINPGSNVAIDIRYLVPVLIEIQGRVYRPKIELKNVGMEHVPPEGSNPATTLISVSVDNVGPTFSRLKPFARIWGFQDGHWRVITRAEFKDAGIIPGAELNLKTDIMRPLPSGKYKIAGAIYVDGRRGTAIAKEMDFVGDPGVKRAPTDAPLDLVPGDVVIEGYLNSTHSSFLEVINSSDETIDIQTLFGLPTALTQTATNAFKGEDLACMDWLKAEPGKFTLRSFERRRIRIVAEIPESIGEHPWHYAVLGLYAHYPDGQMAGLTTTNICVGNVKGVAPEVNIKFGNLIVREWNPEDSQFLIWADFINYGETHLNPVKCRAGLAITSGEMTGAIRSSTTLTCDEGGVMLPLANRKYSGIFDFSSIPPGVYRLEVNMEYAPAQSIIKQMVVQISLDGDRRIVNIIQTAEEIAPNDVIEVQW